MICRDTCSDMSRYMRRHVEMHTVISRETSSVGLVGVLALQTVKRISNAFNELKHTPSMDFLRVHTGCVCVYVCVICVCVICV